MPRRPEHLDRKGTCRALAAQHREAEMNKDELIALDDRGIGAWDTHDVDSFAAMFADDFVYTDDTVEGTASDTRWPTVKKRQSLGAQNTLTHPGFEPD
jgi:hypothetical protein